MVTNVADNPALIHDIIYRSNKFDIVVAVLTIAAETAAMLS